MKFRNGFVSNSSSSSFVIAFPRIPLNIEEVQKMIFGDDPKAGLSHPYDDDWYPASQVAETVFNDINEKSIVPMDKEAILRAFEEDYAIDYFNEYWKEDDPEKREVLRQKSDNQSKIRAQQRCDDFLKDNKGSFVYELVYADEDGSYGCAMEHGDVFQNLSHIRISHH